LAGNNNTRMCAAWRHGKQRCAPPLYRRARLRDRTYCARLRRHSSAAALRAPRLQRPPIPPLRALRPIQRTSAIGRAPATCQRPLHDHLPSAGVTAARPPPLAYRLVRRRRHHPWRAHCLQPPALPPLCADWNAHGERMRPNLTHHLLPATT